MIFIRQIRKFSPIPMGLSVSVCLCVCLSVCLCVCLSVCVFVCYNREQPNGFTSEIVLRDFDLLFEGA